MGVGGHKSKIQEQNILKTADALGEVDQGLAKADVHHLFAEVFPGRIIEENLLKVVLLPQAKLHGVEHKVLGQAAWDVGHCSGPRKANDDDVARTRSGKGETGVLEPAPNRLTHMRCLTPHAWLATLTFPRAMAKWK